MMDVLNRCTEGRAAVFLYKKSRPIGRLLSCRLVEMRRIELLSEDNVTWISPSAVCALF